MKFSTREDLEMPHDAVFAHVSDFNAIERQFLRRGAGVVRRAEGPVVVGATWDVTFTWRGKTRNVVMRLAALDPPNSYRVLTESAALEAETLVDVVPLTPKRTRLAVSVDVSAKTLTGRLLLQSFKLGKTSLDRQFKDKIAAYAKTLVARHAAGS